MNLKGAHDFNAPADQIWNMLMDVNILVKITPGITKLEAIGEDNYKAIADVKMGPVSGSFTGGLQVADKQPTESFLLKVTQNSKIGNVSADVLIMLEALSETETTMRFNGKARLSGVLARTGQRVLSGVANTLTKQFFKGLTTELQSNHHKKA